MTQLENNTTALEAILATVNALPNAGSGGGESGYQMATGTFTVSTGVTAANTVAATVRGLGFTPKEVWVIRSVGRSINVTSTYKNTMYMVACIKRESGDTLYNYVGMASTTSTVSCGIATNNTNPVYEINIKENGFELARGSYTSSTITYHINATTYWYVAIG